MSTTSPSNRAAFTLQEVAAETGGRVTQGEDLRTIGVTTDSRGDIAGNLFVALSGDRFDGHDFALKASESGAAAVVISREVKVPPSVGVVKVDDTLAALGALGRAHRRRWGGRVVAIGGSAGKTTTRATTSATLNTVWPGEVHWVKGNLNNQIGVPMVLLSVEDRHRCAVVEVGTNERGEVSKIGSVVEPDVAVLTLVGLEHTEGLGGIDDIEQEEGDLLRALGPGGIAIANGDDERAARQLREASAERRMTYGFDAGSDYRIVSRRAALTEGSIHSTLEIDRPTGERLNVETPLVGSPGALAAAAAIAVAESMAETSLGATELTQALTGSDAREPGRLTPVSLSDGTLVLDDSYNSNPVSARASIAAASEIAKARGARLVLVLGEMRELGELSQTEHRALGDELKTAPPAVLVGVGGDARAFVEQCGSSNGAFAEDATSARQLVLDRVQPGDVVLVKASRGVLLERVVDGLLETRGSAA